MKRLWLVLLVLLPLPAFLYARDYQVVTFTTANAGKVVFDHGAHFDRLGRNCTLCHNALFSVSGKNPRVTMAQMGEGKSCGACHDDQRAFALKECVRCHVVGNVAIPVADFGQVSFSHGLHLKAFGCSDCHPSLFKPQRGSNPVVTMAQMAKGKSCGACHDGSSAFSVKGDCTKCHRVQEIRFGADATFSHDFHIQAYQCADCHSKLFVAGPKAHRATMAEMAKGRSCGGCHDGRSAFSVRASCDRCHGKAPKEISFAAGKAHFSHQGHLRQYQCADCHSGIFTGGANSRRYTMLDMQQNRSCGACHDGVIAFNVTGNCGRCHSTPQDIDFTLPDLNPVPFSHRVHTALLKCDDCHNGIFAAGVQSKRFTMAQMAKGESCGTCHDGKMAFATTSNCQRCHPLKNRQLAYDALFRHDRHLSMFSCRDCHPRLYKATGDNKRLTMAELEKGQSCGACHDGATAFSVKGDCQRCHITTVEVVLQVPQTGQTFFSHKFHVAAFACTDCHYGIFPAGARARRFTMGDMEKGQSCGACHDGKSAFAVKGDCIRCHPVRDVAFKDSGGASFPHTPHTAMFRCADCHNALYNPGPGNRRVSMPEMEQGKSCGVCHEGKTAFGVSGDCEKCHRQSVAVRYEMPPGKDVEPVVFSHKAHTEKGYRCFDCHDKLTPAGVKRRPATMREMNDGKSCGGCHGFSMAFSVQDPQMCARCHAGDKGAFPGYMPSAPGEDPPSLR